jgi:hypothetical protein
MMPEIGAMLVRMILWLVVAVVIGWTIGTMIGMTRVRNTTRMRVRPLCEPTILNDLPVSFREKLGEIISEFGKFGFVVVAIVTMHEELAGQQTTQWLLINNEQRMRAVIFCQIIRRVYLPYVYFISEFANGREIKTRTARIVPRAPQDDGTILTLTLPVDTPMQEMFERHNRLVTEQGPKDVGLVLPPEGKEVEFIQERHTKARAATMSKRLWRVDGDFYRPTWWMAFVLTAERQPVIGKMLLKRYKKGLVVPTGGGKLVGLTEKQGSGTRWLTWKTCRMWGRRRRGI